MKDRKDTTALERRANELRRSRDSSRVAGWRDQRGEDWEGSGWNEPRVPRDENGWPIEPAPGKEVDADAMLLSDWLGQQHVRYESPRELAHSRAADFVRQHLLDLDPDDLLIATLYLNTLDTAPQRANIGHSFTLTDALMHNWQQEGNGDWFDHLGHLQAYREGGYPARVSPTPLNLPDCFAYEAIYRRTSPQRFDASTHTSIDPKAFKAFVWDNALLDHYESMLNTFWETHGSDYNLLIKAAFLKSAYIQYSEGSMSLEDKTLVLKSLGFDPAQPWERLTFETFRDAPLASTVTFRELILYRYTATDIIVIRDEQTGRLVVYIPGNSSPFHGFEDLVAFQNWIALQCRDTRKRQALERHFKLEDDSDGLFLSGLQTTLAGLAVFPHLLNGATGSWPPYREISLGAALSPWPFSHFRQSLQDRQRSDAALSIRTQSDYRKEALAQGLSTAINVTGAIAMVVPELWLPLAAMSVALLGLGADEVVEGKSYEERKAGVGRVVFGVLNAVPAIAQGAGEIIDAAAAAQRAGEVIPGAADEVGQVIESRSAEQKAAASAQQQEIDEEMAQQARARADEDASAREARLAQEEQSRLLRKAQHEAGYDSAKAFGVEPEGLRSLPPLLRAELARFEYSEPLDLSGSWTRDDFGAVYKAVDPASGEAVYFARIHSRIYRVERVDSVKQYRIFSPEDAAIKGPYIKRLNGFYSDLDLRPGLRGGEGYGDAVAAASAKDEGVTAPVERVRAQPRVQIDVPMDGIEQRTLTDSSGHQVHRFYAMNRPEGTGVYYDADVACWRNKITEELLWLDNNGKWSVGDERRYLSVKSRLRAGVNDTVYTFPRLPGVSAKSLPIDRTIHQIWLGDGLPGPHLIETIKQNIRTSPDLKFALHIDIDYSATVDGLTAEQQLQAEFASFPQMTISSLQDEQFFDGFSLYEQESAEPYAYFRHGQNQNLAAAADVLRYRLIREYGGIYMNCDDVLAQSFKGQELAAGPSDVLVGRPLKSETFMHPGPANSHFASHQGNPVLRAMEKELHQRFKLGEEALGALRHSSRDTQPYLTGVSRMTGSGLFLDVIKKSRPDYAGLLTGRYRTTGNILSATYSERLEEVEKFYLPFANRLKIESGGENFRGDGSGVTEDVSPIEIPEILPPAQSGFLQPDAPAIKVAIPIDGVSESGGRYSIMLDGRQRGVIYDDDAKTWKLSGTESRGLRLDQNGDWQARSVLDEPQPINPNASLEVVELPRLPTMPNNLRPIPRKIHYIWVGSKPLGEARMENLIRNANRSPDFQSVLHVDVDSQEALDLIRASVKNRAPSLAVSNLHDENFFAAFLRGRHQALYHKARHAAGKSYAAASDILRYPLIDTYGGIYMDSDDVLTSAFSGVHLEAAHGDLLLGKAVAVPSLEFRGYNNSLFASHAGNPVLARLGEELAVRNDAQPAFFETPPPQVDHSTPVSELLTSQAMKQYRKTVFELTGPTLFNDVLREQRPDYYHLGIDPPGNLPVRCAAFQRQLETLQDHFFPFQRKAPVEIGNGHDW
ncbi:DUF6543 domain-containing protein [Pseudomonas sp. W2-17]|uniref:dermonecrotic toxin domain-containing protein n=1 Tax=Pseudomonas sp. W2-17 TaxID=3058039 RepID=UPI0034E05C90